AIKEIELFVPKNSDKHISIISFGVKSYNAEDIGMILDEDYNISVRTGYHCAPYIHSHLNDEKYIGTVRIGLGMFNSKEDIDKLEKALKEIINY
nr:aminotransferase class V-fold PLP-dependent enzyme [Lachnospiraceae bacterium]